MEPQLKRTRRQSKTSPLIRALTNLTKELIAQSKANREFAEKLIVLAQEKDAQIKLVLESKFQEFVTTYPKRPEVPKVPEDPQALSDVTEVSEETAEAEMVASNTREKAATKSLEESLEEEFQEIAKEHAEAHGQQVQT